MLLLKVPQLFHRFEETTKLRDLMVEFLESTHKFLEDLVASWLIRIGIFRKNCIVNREYS